MRHSKQLFIILLSLLIENCKSNETQTKSIAVIAIEGIICDKFEVITKLEGSKLSISLDTDLPDNTDIMVNVSRTYLEKDNSSVYAVDYFESKETVDKWRIKREILLNNDLWKKELKDKQAKLKPLGLGGEIMSINQKVSINVTIPINQRDSRFGKVNANLKGKEVIQEGNWKLVRKKIELTYQIK